MSDFKAKCNQFEFGWGSTQDPAGGGWGLEALLQIP